jgi:anthraniloyl-CoA monooxygenase
MKITVIGGGPAGLYFSILVKKSFPDADITVFERNGPNDTFGWGVVFSGRTLKELEENDLPSYQRILEQFETWDNVDVVHRDEKVTIRGNHFNGISRLTMLQILEARAEELGVSVTYHSEIQELRQFNDSDIILIADGVNSLFRRQYTEHFQPTISVRSNKYIWYGTTKLFHGLTLTFRENEHGIFAAHSYKFSKTHSTFVVECDEATWRSAGLDSMNEEQYTAYIEKVFAKDLEGHSLLSNRSVWINFQLIKCAHWVHENMVIVGDAAHTAHFSIGSGTKMALEDVIALADELKKEKHIPTALVNYEQNRRPVVEDLQAAAQQSLVLFENLGDVIDLSPLEMAYRMMTRSGKIDDERIKRRDPEFMERLLAERATPQNVW